MIFISTIQHIIDELGELNLAELRQIEKELLHNIRVQQEEELLNIGKQ